MLFWPEAGAAGGWGGAERGVYCLPTALAPVVRAAFANVDPNLPLFDVRTMQEHLTRGSNLLRHLADIRRLAREEPFGLERRSSLAIMRHQGFRLGDFVVHDLETQCKDSRLARIIHDRLHTDLKAAVATPAMQKQIALLGMIPIDSPPVAAMAAYINSEITRWSGVVEQAGLAGTQ